MRSWTDAEKDFLRKHWPSESAGDLARLLAERFGLEVSRCAVMGQIYRLGLATPPGRQKGRSRNGVKNAAIRAGHRTDEATKGDPAKAKAGQTRLRKGWAASQAIIEGRGLPLRALPPRCCAWPISNDPLGGPVSTHACGATAPEGQRYCARHAAIAAPKHAPAEELLDA